MGGCQRCRNAIKQWVAAIRGGMLFELASLSRKLHAATSRRAATVTRTHLRHGTALVPPRPWVVLHRLCAWHSCGHRACHAHTRNSTTRQPTRGEGRVRATPENRVRGASRAPGRQCVPGAHCDRRCPSNALGVSLARRVQSARACPGAPMGRQPGAWRRKLAIVTRTRRRDRDACSPASHCGRRGRGAHRRGYFAACLQQTDLGPARERAVRHVVDAAGVLAVLNL